MERNESNVSDKKLLKFVLLPLLDNKGSASAIKLSGVVRRMSK